MSGCQCECQCCTNWDKAGERAHRDRHLEALALVREQAEDAGLWFPDWAGSQIAYLQRALRELHRAVEGET